MDYKVIWTDEAIADLRQLVAFISQDNPAAAARLGQTLIRKSMILASQPQMGRRLRKSPKDSIRELIVPPYRMIYEISAVEPIIYVRLLWHGARQEPRI